MRKKKKKIRCEQDSNLRGESPLDFKSNALTTRPSQHLQDVLIFNVAFELSWIFPSVTALFSKKWTWSSQDERWLLMLTECSNKSQTFSYANLFWDAKVSTFWSFHVMANRLQSFFFNFFFYLFHQSSDDTGFNTWTWNWSFVILQFLRDLRKFGETSFDFPVEGCSWLWLWVGWWDVFNVAETALFQK